MVLIMITRGNFTLHLLKLVMKGKVLNLLNTSFSFLSSWFRSVVADSFCYEPSYKPINEVFYVK